jgi:hypothetical protein
LREAWKIETPEEDMSEAPAPYNVEDFEMLTTRFKSQQESMWAAAEVTFRPPVPSFEDELLTKLCTIFNTGHGIAVQEDPNALLAKLEEYCVKVKEAGAQWYE